MGTDNLFVIGRNYTENTCIPEGRSQASKNLACCLVDAGLDPCIVSLGSYPLTMDRHIHVSSLSGLNVVTIPDVNYPSFLQKLKIGDLLSLFPVLRFLIREYELIYLLNVKGMYFSLISQLILRIERRSDKIVKHLFNSPTLWDLSARFIKRGVYDHVLCTSRSLKRHLSNVVSDRRVHYVPYPIDTGSFRPRNKHEIRKLLRLPLDVNIVGHVGHVTVERGAFDLIKAFSKLSRKNLLLVVLWLPHTLR
ncbi:MAG: hypothetical protein ACUVTD_01215 [Nitrososphaerales archaeon]